MTRSTAPRLLASLALALLLAGPAAGQSRPDEGELFGSPSPPQVPAQQPAATPPPPGPQPPGAPSLAGSTPSAASADLEGEPGAERRLRGALGATDDPLRLGGILYLRANLSAREDTPPSQWSLTAPSLTDLYLDVRPIDRVRGFVLGRLLFDPTQGSTIVGPLPGGATQSNPHALLDQLWLRFDVARVAFVTLGRQHVKWGVGRFWNPTDYLHAVRRNPLAVFDERTGTYMARVHIPWERRGWNFYAVAVLERLVTQAGTGFDPSTGLATGAGTTSITGSDTGTLGTVGGGARAEVVLGGWELGLDAVAQRGIRPRFGIDLSGGLWELDLKAEVSLRTGSDVPLYQGSLAAFAPREPRGVRPAVVAGADWAHKYSDEDSLTVVFEYFYNSNGYGYKDRSLYPVLLLSNAFTPFYLGRHYLGAFLSLPQPGSWNLHTFTFSAIANLSDRTGVARLDWAMTFLTYLQLEAYVQAHFGSNGGEFRLGVDLPAQVVGGAAIPAVRLGAPSADMGLALRLSL